MSDGADVAAGHWACRKRRSAAVPVGSNRRRRTRAWFASVVAAALCSAAPWKRSASLRFLASFVPRPLRAAGWGTRAKTVSMAATTAVTAQEELDSSGITKEPPSMDWPPMSSVTWPRHLVWLGSLFYTVKALRRLIFGGAEAVALDPTLPWSVRKELLLSRRSLRSRAKDSPGAFRRMIKAAADTLEEVPALLVTVAVLAGDALRAQGYTASDGRLSSFRKLGEATALLFTAGRLHLGMESASSVEADGSAAGEANKRSTMRLLGGDFLYAEGQWMLAELGCMPNIKLTARMIRNFSDGCSAGAPAFEEDLPGRAGELGAQAALPATFLRTGTYFAAAASGAAWLSGAPPQTVKALHRYGSDLGCALMFAQHDDANSQDCAVWLAQGAQQALDRALVDSPAKRAMARLAHRVERTCAASLRRLIREEAQQHEHGANEGHDHRVRGISFAEFEDLESKLDDFRPAFEEESAAPADDAVGLGYQRDDAAEKELQALIAAGLDDAPQPPEPSSFEWPAEGGPKGALQGALQCVGRELLQVNAQLDGPELAAPARSELVRDEVIALFGAGGKRLRPALVLLVARALGAPEADLKKVVSLAVSVEVLHGASLVHDDILDGADTRRGKRTAHVRRGQKAAALAGDFLFATASCLVAELGSLPTVLLISKVVADFGRGELAQSAVKFETLRYSLTDYLAKSFYKTASLLAAACQAAAVLSGQPPSSEVSRACYRFGAFLGLAFQVVDDVLDFTATEEELGKPALQDLREGNLSAPVLYVAQANAGGTAEAPNALTNDERAQLIAALDRRIAAEGDLERVLEFVDRAGGIPRAKALARRYVDLAIAELQHLPDGEARQALRVFAEYVFARTY